MGLFAASGSGRPAGRRRLTIREALELSPWDKWLSFGIVPWKMLLHLLLVFFITLLASPLSSWSECCV